ncbi:MAG: thiamine pyrophosphate-dependent enzyme, partial [bacterium]
MKMVMEREDKELFMNITANQCPGCPENLATKLIMQIMFETLGEDQPIIYGQGCGIGRDFLQRTGLGTHDSGCAAMKTAMAIRGIDRPLIVIDGDGQVDMGLDDVASSFQQGYRYMHIVCDNQGHAASGSHATGTTDPLARVSSRPTGRVQGRLQGRKHFTLMLMFSGASYVATASVSHVRDLERKLKEGMQRLPAFIQILTPCNPSWGYDDDKGVTVAKKAVTTGLWPLYEWKDGVFRRT